MLRASATKRRGDILLIEARCGRVLARARLTGDPLATDSILQMQCCQDELKDHVLLERTKTSGGGQDDVEQQK